MDFDAYEALGLERPEEVGENEQEVAEPAHEGGNEQEVAEPAHEEEEEENEETLSEPEQEEEPEPEEEAEPQEKKSTQTKAERAENAKRRRQAETEAAIREAVAQKERELTERYNGIIAAAGLTNPFGEKKPVSGISDLEAYTKARKQREIEAALREGKLTPEALKYAVEESEPMQAIRKLVAEKSQAEEREAKQRIESQIEEIGKYDPKIKSVSDLLRMENADQFQDYVRRGLNFVEAYQLANANKLREDAVAAAKREVMNSAKSREHLKPTPQRGIGELKTVPPDVMEMYRIFNPGATDAEIQAHYNKHNK